MVHIAASRSISDQSAPRTQDADSMAGDVNEHGTVGLLGQLAGLEDHFRAAHGDTHRDVALSGITHMSSNVAMFVEVEV